jgi:tRNA A37 threonylcarbamoyltransferase TsaD
LGEAYDKIARELNLDFAQGAAALEKEALKFGQQNNNTKTKTTVLQFPVPLLKYGNCDFSFAGLKSSVLRTVSRLQPLDTQKTSEIAWAFQETALEHVCDKLTNALKLSTNKKITESPLNCIVVAGGVAKNQRLRYYAQKAAERASIHNLETWKFQMERENYTKDDEMNATQVTNINNNNFLLPVYFPEAEYCTDNGTMIAWTGIEILNAIENNEIHAKELFENINSILRERVFYPSDQDFENKVENLNFKPKWPLSAEFVDDLLEITKQQYNHKQSKYPEFVNIKRKGLKEKFSHVTNKL